MIRAAGEQRVKHEEVLVASGNPPETAVGGEAVMVPGDRLRSGRRDSDPRADVRVDAAWLAAVLSLAGRPEDGR